MTAYKMPILAAIVMMDKFLRVLWGMRMPYAETSSSSANLGCLSMCIKREKGLNNVSFLKCAFRSFALRLDNLHSAEPMLGWLPLCRLRTVQVQLDLAGCMLLGT